MKIGLFMLREMVRADLELAFEHLNADNEALAEFELRNALEKISQMKQLRSLTAIDQPPLLTLGTEHGTTREGPRTDTPNQR